MKKVTKLLLVLVAVISFKSTKAQTVFNAGNPQWTYFFGVLTVGDDLVTTESNSRVVDDKQGIKSFIGNKNYVLMAITPLIFAIAEDSSLSILNLHSENINVILDDSHSSLLLLKRGEFKNLPYKQWIHSRNSLCFQEIVGNYIGNRILVPYELFSVKNLDYLDIIESGFMPLWDLKYEVSGIKLTKSDKKEITFELIIPGSSVLDKRIFLGITGIYLSHDKGLALGGCKINPIKSKQPTSDTITVSIVKSGDSITNSDFVMPVPILEFNKALKIVKNQSFSISLYIKDQFDSVALKNYHNWHIQGNGIGKQW